MKKTLTVALSLLSLAAFSQKNFKPGYIVLSCGNISPNIIGLQLNFLF